MQKVIIRNLLILMICCSPFTSNAWGVIGHRVVGEIADKYLSSDARREIKALIGTESIGMASNWMDFIKSDSTYKYLGNWHYVNIRGGMSQTDFYNYFAQDTATDAYTRIQFVSRELKNKSLPVATRAMYLKILVHLVGDIHQPLHIGRAEDQGGNRIRVSWFNDNVNLHQVWDEKLVNFQQLSYTEYANVLNYVTKAQRKAWQKQTLLDWIWESYQHAERIYGDIRPEDKLGYNYNFKYVSVVNEQLLKGGVRLAGLLNEIFD